MPIKTLGSLGKIRVGRVTGNTHIFFFGLMNEINLIAIKNGNWYCWLIIFTSGSSIFHKREISFRVLSRAKRLYESI